MSKMWPSSIFKEPIFPAENAGNMPEKPVFGHFLEISSLVFSDFLHKDASDLCEKFFPGQKYRQFAGNRRFCRFSSDFFLYFVVFSHKNIINKNAHHKAWFIFYKKLIFVAGTF